MRPIDNGVLHLRKKFVASLLAVAIASTTACAQLGISKEQAGTVIGGLAGVAIGSTGSGNGKIAAALIAGGIGAYVGNRIGNMLDEKDQQALALRTQEVLSQQQATASAQPVTWKSDHSGASAQIVPGKEYTKTKQVEVKRAQDPGRAVDEADQRTVCDHQRQPERTRRAERLWREGRQPEEPHRVHRSGATGDWILVGRKG